ncbi:MAG: hypothetical protein WCT04_11750 [Planctomycetota bacterium]
MDNGVGVDPVAIIVGVLGLGCCFLFVAGFAFLIYRLLSKKPSSQREASLTDRATPSNLPPVSGRVAQYGKIVSNISDDGFYLFNNFLTPGTMIHYRYQGPSGWITQSVPYQPGPRGHFVYVGSPPRDIQIVDVVSNSPRNARAASNRNVDDDFDDTIVAPNPDSYSNAGTSATVPPSLVRTIPVDYPSAY